MASVRWVDCIIPKGHFVIGFRLFQMRCPMGRAMRNEDPTVYSTESGRICPGCGRKRTDCTCKKQVAEQKGDRIIRVQQESKGRKGKTVTLVKGVGEICSPCRNWEATSSVCAEQGGGKGWDHRSAGRTRRSDRGRIETTRDERQTIGRLILPREEDGRKRAVPARKRISPK